MWLPEVKNIHTPAALQRVLDLHIPVDLPHFAGHFPGLPLLPGVVQVDWAARWAQEFFQIEGDFLSLDNLKFQAMIFPGDDIRVLLHWLPEKAQVNFTYSKVKAMDEDHVLSAGRLSFSGRAV